MAQGKAWYATIVLASCVAFGVVLAAIVSYAGICVWPSDVARVCRLFAATRTNGPKARIVVLGSSVVMSGFDARELGEQSHSLAWNFGTPGQMLGESMVLADALPAESRSVVLGIRTANLTVTESPVPRSRWAAFIAAGYRPTQRLRAMAKPRTVISPILSIPAWRAAINARWATRSALDFALRRRLRPDLDFDRAQTDVFYPAPFTRPVSSTTLRHLLELNSQQTSSFQVSPSVEQDLLLLREILAAKHVQLTVVVMPDHPEIRARRQPKYDTALVAWTNQARSRYALNVIDLHDSLSADGFIDDIHPSHAGAMRITSAVARWLAESRPPKR